MRKLLVATGGLLLLGALLVAATAGVGYGQRQVDEYAIPLDTDVYLTGNMTVHIIQLTMSNITYGGAYSPDPEHSVWPVITFQYENRGMSQLRGRLHLQIVDNSSTVPPGYTYDKVDYTIPQPITPGQKSQPVTLEFAIPKGRLVTKLVIIDDDIGHRIAAEIPIVYPSAAPAATATPESAIPAVDDNLRNLLIIPILLGIVGLVGWLMARNRLF